MSDNFYRAFEDRYRGARPLIKARLMAYQPFFAPLAALYPGGAVLDLGCGRGEWLELLTEHGFAPRGVDLDQGMLAACRERGLHAELTDALSALRACGDASVAMVSAFHLVEHIPFDQVQLLIAEALRVLLPGGLLIMETPNPENLVVGASSFYMDPSHLKPIPAPLLEFVTGFAGFPRHKVLRLQEAAQLHTDAPIGLINVLDGVSPDYAVLGQKDAPPEALAAFAAPFAAKFGIGLSDLALRFEEQDNQRRNELHAGIARAEHTIQRVEHALQDGLVSLGEAHQGVARVAAGVEQHRLRLEMAEPILQRVGPHADRLAELQGQMVQQVQLALQAQTQFQAQIGHIQGQLQGQLDALGHRTGVAEARAQQADAHVAALLASSSWRVTAPLRALAGTTYRLRSAAREGRLASGVKRRLSGPLLTFMRAMLRRPRIKRVALTVLRRFPGLHARLYGVLRRGNAPPPPPAAAAPTPSASAADLSPREQRMYHELKQAMEARNK
ncbi:class I SAM-dependent methyltransferase [Massilia sp. DJPM01]|uniref:class I SAM-dependent methyltransferase n=1 Tax=Massilia sp. DJPM01 TaxID=3024404 RepID=UPI00259F10A3|nr:class I SAM-dependent methyltransferase [Massilia sp. DJPM01]MDM5178186.1 class I SAM-dependent methyltransferase [Massilia sp. DJPM01]